MSIEGQGHFFTIYFPGFVCFVLYLDKISGERLQDHLSSGCLCENKDADQLRGNHEADQRLCFLYTDSKIPLLSESEISSLQPYSVIAQPNFCQTWSETPKTGFLTTRLKLDPTRFGVCSVCQNISI